MNVGVVGCGNISGIYLENCAKLDNLKVVALADLDLEKARKKAAEYGIAKACSFDDLLADPDVQIVLNLTVPLAHADELYALRNNIDSTRRRLLARKAR